MLVSQLLDGGGSERQVRQLAIALNRLHFEVHLASFRSNEKIAEQLRQAGVQTVDLAVTSLASPKIVGTVLNLRSYVKQHGIQLLHAFDAPSSTLAVPMARLARVPLVLASQRGNRALDPPLAHKLRWLTDPMAHGIVVNAEALADHLEAEGIARTRIRFCPNGLDTARFSPQGRQRIPRLEHASAVVGCVAAHRPEKELPFLVDAFAEARRQRPGLQLVMVGSGTETPKILERVQAHNLGGDCLMIPHTPDTAEILRSIDIFLLTSVSEGQSNSLMEAMACGCAVVASRVEGTRDLVRDGVNGFLFEFGSQADLVAKVLSLVDDPELRRKIACDASAWVRSTMSVEASAARMAAIYDEFIGKANSARVSKASAEAHSEPRP